jgi:hypothetical protein
MSLKVFITVDTEVYPLVPGWRENGLAGDIRRDIYGDTPSGEFGLRYQMQVLNRYGLKAVFFVEPLYACEMGLETLKRTVGEIQESGHEVQIHIHTEWLQWMTRPPVATRGKNIGDFSEEDQFILLGQAKKNLEDAGAARLCAFRAGNYGADNRTLRALARLGIAYDTSYNYCYLNAPCRIQTPEPLLQPAQLDGVTEFPVSYFADWPGHYRHFQLCACSAAEIRNVLLSAWQRKWHSVVMVSHGFELLRKRKQPRAWAIANRIAIRRFEWMCRYLAENRDKFEAATFGDLEQRAWNTAAQAPLQSMPVRTAFRYMEQIAARLLWGGVA